MIRQMSDLISVAMYTINAVQNGWFEKAKISIHKISIIIYIIYICNT